MAKKAAEVQVGDWFGCRVVVRTGWCPRHRRRLFQLRCDVCGVLTVLHGRVPGPRCQLCVRNQRREDPARYRAHL